MTPKVKIFENVYPDSATRHRTTFRGQIWWKSAFAKFPKGRLVYQTKKLRLRGTRPSPHFGQNGPIAPKIPWTLSPVDMSTFTEFGPDRLRFAGLILERLIFRPKSQYNNAFSLQLWPIGSKFNYYTLHNTPGRDITILRPNTHNDSTVYLRNSQVNSLSFS